MFSDDDWNLSIFIIFILIAIISISVWELGSYLFQHITIGWIN